MKLRKYISVLAIFITCFSLVSFSDAAEPVNVRVIKTVQGKALIYFNKEQKIPLGLYQLVEQKKDASATATAADKDRFISLSLDSSLLTQKTTTSGAAGAPVDIKSFNSSLTYGWNKVTWEFGPFLSYAFNTTGTVDVKTLVGGFFVDKNFSPNDLERDFVFGLRLQGGVGQEDSSSYTKAAQVTLLQASLFLKWFGLNPHLGLVSELGYRTQEAKVDLNATQTQGTFLRLGVISYF